MSTPEKNQMFMTGRRYGVDVNCSSPAQAMEELEALRDSGKRHYVCFLEGNLLFQVIRNREVRRVLNEASLVYPDGIAIYFNWSLHFRSKFRRVPGPSMMLWLCRYGADKGWKHFFAGGSPGTPERLAQNLRAQIPGLNVVGCYSPPFRRMTEEEEEDLKRRIDELKPDFLWVGLGGPKQEFWMKEHLNELDVPVMLGVGAAFDFHSGNLPWAPAWVRKCGLEWLWRAFTGGGKTFVRNLKCVAYVLCVLVKEVFLFPLPVRRAENLKLTPKPPCREESADGK